MFWFIQVMPVLILKTLIRIFGGAGELHYVLVHQGGVPPRKRNSWIWMCKMIIRIIILKCETWG